MANKEQLAILKEGVDVWNKWRKENPHIRPNLKGAELNGESLCCINFSNTDLSGIETKLMNAKLCEANLKGANLCRTELQDANLWGADLSGSDTRLMDASLQHADLTRANFSDVCAKKIKINDARSFYTKFCRADLENAYLWGTDFREADFREANLTGADLRNTNLVQTNFDKAILNDCLIYGVSAWNLNLEGAEQSNLVITRHDEPAVTVSNMKVAQFLYLLISNPEIRDVIDTITTKVVLILGRFTGERLTVLEALRTELQKRDYIPVLFDFDAPKNRDVEETVSTLAHMARFIIADITDPKAIPQELSTIVRNLQSVPVLPLLQDSAEPWGMFASIKRRPTVLPILEYSSEAELIGKIQSEVIEVAEQKVIELKP